jgi:hypothetical protein
VLSFLLYFYHDIFFGVVKTHTPASVLIKDTHSVLLALLSFFGGGVEMYTPPYSSMVPFFANDDEAHLETTVKLYDTQRSSETHFEP